jgi:FkbM family methyltransferase
MKVFPGWTKIVLLPIYYLFHKNICFGLIQKYIIKKFYYKNLKLEIPIKLLPTSHYSSFFFKTYEYNDRKLIERNVSKINKCIIIGAGIGFVPCLAYSRSKNKILVFEIDKRIKKNLLKNLKENKCIFDFYDKNLILKKNKKNDFFYFDNNFLNNSKYRITDKKIKISNILSRKIKEFQDYNTIIIDAEGIEEYFIKNIKYLKKIKYLFFELHYDLINKKQITNLKKILKKNKFKLLDQCFNSFYYKKFI